MFGWLAHYLKLQQSEDYGMTFLILVTLIVIVVLLWKLTDFTPDLTFQLREIQSDLAAIRATLEQKDSQES